MYSYWLDKNNSLTPSGGQTQRANYSIHPDVHRLAESHAVFMTCMAKYNISH